MEVPDRNVQDVTSVNHEVRKHLRLLPKVERGAPKLELEGVGFASQVSGIVFAAERQNGI